MSVILDAQLAGWRACLVTETYPPEINGVALTVERLAHGLRARGHVVSIICPRRRVASHVRGIDDDVVEVPGVTLPGYRDLCVGLPAGRRLRELWTRQRPDIVYVATEGPLGWSAQRVARRLGVPVWSGFHTRFPEYARHYGGRWLAPAAWTYLRRFHNRTRGTIVADDGLRAELTAAGFANVHVLGRGVDSERFCPARRSKALRTTWGVRETDVAALYVGRLAAEKNVPLAIDAYRAMARAQTRVRLVIVGDGPLRGALEQAHPDVLFRGTQTGDTLAAHYASADVFLFPSETETFGNVTLEAMASGLAVVAYDYAAAGAHIVDGVSGALAPRGDARAFVRRASALAQSPERLVSLGMAAREHAARIGWAAIVDAFEALLRGDARSFETISARSGGHHAA